MFEKCLKASFALTVLTSALGGGAVAQTTSETSTYVSHIECASDPHYRREAIKKIRHASKHLLNRKLSVYGGGKNVKVTLHRCEMSVLEIDGAPRPGVIDASYELTWRKKALFDRTTHFLVLDAQIDSDGSAANFSIIDAGHTLNTDFIRAFPVQTLYFNSYND